MKFKIGNDELPKQIEVLKRMHKRELSMTLSKASSHIREITTNKQHLQQQHDDLKQLLECSICMDNRKDSTLYCGHQFCGNCLVGAKNSCPICRRIFHTIRPIFW